ncbi:hypothetical protein [Beggiatoa leptomitoformis]|uniref:Helix-turn-helix domain-containing protein n=1 Tax=Beggiatoa leptomitoformis TaxID=288004 RepID=A0A2N9YCZ1_9GAMM|nr:hypothetical protein [Beggiatoa leptomitoformis]AUI68306.1 hypothetical protein BLE401_06050 [Beggiatoa leptomitoformis]QGX03423.1 hypothetical protein AL038_18171 [Beggiatoa leptomitoformis]
MKTTKEKRIGIIRVAPKRKNYTPIDNEILTDLRLSMSATGLACRLLRQFDDWDINVAYLVKYYQEGEYKIRKIIKELVSFGYMHAETRRNEKGQFIGYCYTLYEHPSLNPNYVEPENITCEASTEPEIIEVLETHKTIEIKELEPVETEATQALIFDYALKDYTEKMKAEATKVLQGVPNPQDVLDELNENLSKGTVKNASGFLISLAQRARRGDFIATNQLAEKRRKRAEREKWEAMQKVQQPLNLPPLPTSSAFMPKSSTFRKIQQTDLNLPPIKTISAEEREKMRQQIIEYQLKHSGEQK